MASPSLAETVLFGFVYLAVASAPVVLVALTLAEFAGSVRLSLVYVVGTLGAVTALGTVSAALSIGVDVVGPAAAAVLAGAVGLCAVPVLVGRELDRRVNDRPPDAALGDALVGLPVGLVGGVVVLSSREWIGVDYRAMGPTVLFAVVALVVGIAVTAPTIVGLSLGRIRSGTERGET